MIRVALAAAVWMAIASFALAQVSMTGAGAGAPGSGSGAVLLTTPLLSLAGGSSVDPNTSTPAQYVGFVGGPGGTISTTITTHQYVMPISVTVSGLAVAFPVAVATGSYAISLNVAGTSTALTCTISSGTTCTDATDTVSVGAGQLVTWQIVATGTPTTQTGSMQISALAKSSYNQESVIFGGPPASTTSTASTNYSSFGGALTWNATEATVSNVIPASGTLDSLYVVMDGTAGASSYYTFTVMHNGSASTVVAGGSTSSCGGGSSIACSDIAGCIGGATTCTHSIAVVAGDTISVQEVPSATAPTARHVFFAMRFVPAVANQALLFDTGAVPSALTTVRYFYLNGAGDNATVEANDFNIAPVLTTHMTIGNLYVAQCPGPDTTGTAVTRNVTLRSAGANQTPTVTIPGGSTACPTLTTAQDATHTFQPTTGATLGLATSLNTTTNASTTTEFKTSATVTVP